MRRALVVLAAAAGLWLGTGSAGADGGSVFLGQPGGARLPLHAGDTVDFGQVPVGGAAGRDFIVENETSAPITVFNASLSGSYFAFAGAPGLLPANLAPGAAIVLPVRFAPKFPGVRSATVRIEHQDFFLQGEGVDTFPQPTIFLNLPSPHSAQQGALFIYLPSPSPVSGEGKVTIEFRPAVAGVLLDPGVLFLATGTATVPFTVTEGESVGRFGGGKQQTEFQTGTTAGTLTFTATLRDVNGRNAVTIAPATATIAPAPIGLDATQALRTAPGLAVKINGFDNTRTASRVTFTFFDGAGNEVAPGAIQVDLSSDFQNYFGHSQVGGAFGLRAAFPVTGDVSKIDAVSVQMVNTAGTTRLDRLRFATQ